MGLTLHGTLAIDDNEKPVMGGTSSVDNATIINSAYDPTTRRLLVDDSGSGGSTGAVILATDTGDHQNFTLAETATTTQFFIIMNNSSYAPTDIAFPYSLTGANTVLTFNSPLPTDLAGSQIFLVCV